MGEQAGPPSKQVQAVKQVQELVKDGDDAVIVGVFSSEQDAAYEIYIEACKYQVQNNWPIMSPLNVQYMSDTKLLTAVIFHLCVLYKYIFFKWTCGYYSHLCLSVRQAMR